MAPKKRSKKKKQTRDAVIAALEKRLRAIEPKPHKALELMPATKKNKSDDANVKENAEGAVHAGRAMRKFEELPLSQPTLTGLADNKFKRMTDIQRASLPFSLCGRDVLGAAKTGSGKTLAFVIPLLECLYRRKWTVMDGLGGLVISPTRELAIQIFEVLRKVGVKHDLSAGLIIGGKQYQAEKDRINHMNILVCTPGRLQQHMEQTPGFVCDNLQMLVLDEADRILDMGFRDTLNAIVDYLPSTRQTLLFSATQTRSLKALATLSLNNPEYVAVHEQSDSATPSRLTQSYMVLEAHQKFDMLFSFIRTHLTSKCIVFVSSCKQVKFLFEMFRRLRPGVALTSVHGNMKQAKRTAIYYAFEQHESCVMFATNLLSRGMDFSGVDWVVQMDCPDDVESYIHRSGRTARYRSKGQSLLFLLPSEVAFVKRSKAKGIPMVKVKAQVEKLLHVQKKFQSYIAEEPELKYTAQKAFICYMRSVHLQSDKSVFDVTKIDAAQLAAAMGLPGTPKLKFTGDNSQAGQSDAKKRKNEPYLLRQLREEGTIRTKPDKAEQEPFAQANRLLRKKNTNVLDPKRRALVESDSDEEGGEEWFNVKRKDHELGSASESDDEYGHTPASGGSDDDTGVDGGVRAREQFKREGRSKLAREDPTDVRLDQSRVREMHFIQKMKIKGKRRRNDEEETVVVLGSGGEDDEEDDDDESPLAAKRQRLSNESDSDSDSDVVASHSDSDSDGQDADALEAMALQMIGKH